jgi:hypothetical protein
VNEHVNRRKHFRLPYPIGTGPQFVTGDAAFPVVELSERGMHFTCGAQAPAPGKRMVGSLRFPDGTEVPVEGIVVRTVWSRVVVRLVRGVALGRMLAEQRRVLRDFPTFLKTSSEAPE